MNAMDLIYGLNNVRDSYVASAEAFRQRKPKRLPKRKLWLIAALIALTLLLVGCAVVYVLRLLGRKPMKCWEAAYRIEPCCPCRA